MDIFQLQSNAQALDLRNRVIPADDFDPEVSRVPGRECTSCGHILMPNEAWNRCNICIAIASPRGSL